MDWQRAESGESLVEVVEAHERRILLDPGFTIDTVRTGLEAFAAETGVDEMMIVSHVHDHQARLRSVALIAEAMKS